MLVQSWSIKLSQQPLYATIIKGEPSSSIVFQGISNQLNAYTNNNTFSLPIRKQIIQLSSLPSGEILILTRYNLICYDLNNNNELFIKQFQNAEKLFVTQRYIYVTCAGDINCFTTAGQEEYINHLGNNILEVLPVQNSNGQEEVLIALDDMSMKKYKGVNVIFDYSKVVGMVNTMCWIDGGVMIGTDQGTIAYYESKKSKWKAKSTHSTLKILNWRIKQKDNILVVRKNGTIEIRDHKKGETINKIKTNEHLVSLFLSDFRAPGIIQLVCICQSSTVRAYNFEEQQIKIQQKNKIGQQIQDELKRLDQLLKQKAQLEYDVRELEQLMKKEETETNQVGQESPLDPNFSIKAEMKYQKGMILAITCLNGFISGLSFQQPILPFKIDRAEKMEYTFKNQNKVAGEITCQALCHSSFSSKSYEIKSFKITLSKFWHWGYVTEKKVQKEIQGSLKFDLIQRNARYLKWMQQCFFFNVSQDVMNKLEQQPQMKIRFYNAYQNEEMEIIVKSKQGKVEIKCNSLQIIGQMIQDLMEYVGGKELDSVFTFPPKQKERLKDVLTNIEKLSQTKVSINSEMAQAINNIKFLLVKGQSALAVGNINTLRKSYNDVMTQNKNILLQIQKKNLNTVSLSDLMKQLGKFINQTSNLRFGKMKQTIINKCRESIKNKNFPKIISIMERGMNGV